jgi:hypothetical protein
MISTEKTSAFRQWMALSILLLLLVFQPVILAAKQSNTVLTLVLVASLAAVSILPLSKLFVRIKYLMTGVVVLLSVIHYMYDTGFYTKLAYILCFVSVMLFGIVAQASYLWQNKQIGGIALIHVISIYLFLGYLFAACAWLIEVILPGSFQISNQTVSHQLHDFVYFSFVTLATLGYGDIVPVGEMAKVLAIGITLVGQFYMVLFIAMIVGRYMQPQIKD